MLHARACACLCLHVSMYMCIRARDERTNASKQSQMAERLQTYKPIQLLETGGTGRPLVMPCLNKVMELERNNVQIDQNTVKECS